eukprot:sb/3461687/
MATVLLTLKGAKRTTRRSRVDKETLTSPTLVLDDPGSMTYTISSVSELDRASYGCTATYQNIGVISSESRELIVQGRSPIILCVFKRLRDCSNRHSVKSCEYFALNQKTSSNFERSDLCNLMRNQYYGTRSLWDQSRDLVNDLRHYDDVTLFHAQHQLQNRCRVPVKELKKISLNQAAKSFIYKLYFCLGLERPIVLKFEYNKSQLISSVRRYGMWNMIRGSLLGVLDDMRHDSKFTKSSPNHVPHSVSSHTANELSRIISFRCHNKITTFNVYREVFEECERSETLARQLLGTIYTTFENQTCCRLLNFLLGILIMQGGCLITIRKLSYDTDDFVGVKGFGYNDIVFILDCRRLIHESSTVQNKHYIILTYSYTDGVEGNITTTTTTNSRGSTVTSSTFSPSSPELGSKSVKCNFQLNNDTFTSSSSITYISVCACLIIINRAWNMPFAWNLPFYHNIHPACFLRLQIDPNLLENTREPHTEQRSSSEVAVLDFEKSLDNESALCRLFRHRSVALESAYHFPNMVRAIVRVRATFSSFRTDVSHRAGFTTDPTTTNVEQGEQVTLSCIATSVNSNTGDSADGIQWDFKAVDLELFSRVFEMWIGVKRWSLTYVRIIEDLVERTVPLKKKKKKGSTLKPWRDNPEVRKVLRLRRKAESAWEDNKTGITKKQFNDIKRQFGRVDKEARTNVPEILDQQALVFPTIKIPYGDKDSLTNYRPVSNLPFISKFLEKVVLEQLNSYLNENELLNKHQSGYRVGHSCESLLMGMFDDLLRDLDEGKVTGLFLLDMSAAFDTVGHGKLLEVLERRFGVKGSVLDWFASYLQSRTYRVHVDGELSRVISLICGVPQGSLLGPVLFLLYVEELQDLQLYISLVLTDEENENAAKVRIKECLSSVKLWMSTHWQHRQEKPWVFFLTVKKHCGMLLKNLWQVNRCLDKSTAFGETTHHFETGLLQRPLLCIAEEAPR